MRINRNFCKKAQSIVEYTFIIGIISAALMSMNTYAKRGIQAVIKLSADKFSEGDAGGQTGAIPNLQQTWFTNWQPTEPKRKAQSRSGTLKKHEINSASGKVTAVAGTLRKSGTIFNYSIGYMKQDKVIE
ncbi:MAG: hypothetical protein ABH858_02560 [Candidatus Omnitrophota bacterium]